MPIFECPQCGTQQYVPMAAGLEGLLDSLPTPRLDAQQTPIYVDLCLDCQRKTGETARQSLTVDIVEGDLLDQHVDVIVNAWNRNIIPWWLLIPQGVSGAIKRRGGFEPFRELARHGAIPLGGAVLTGAGKLPFRGIIHVAGISMWWVASERSIRDSTRNAVVLAHHKGFTSIAFPLIGAGTGGARLEKSKSLMLDELSKLRVPMAVKLVVFKPGQL